MTGADVSDIPLVRVQDWGAGAELNTMFSKPRFAVGILHMRRPVCKIDPLCRFGK